MTTAPALEPLADCERLISSWLRADPTVSLIAGDRVYCVWPRNQPEQAKQPLVLITRIGGGPVFPRPLALDEAELQLDAYAGRKHEAWQLAAAVAAALERATDQPTPDGIVHGGQ